MKTSKTMALTVSAMLMGGAVGHAQPQTELDIVALLNRLRAILTSYEISVPADGDAQAIIESGYFSSTIAHPPARIS